MTSNNIETVLLSEGGTNDRANSLYVLGEQLLVAGNYFEIDRDKDVVWSIDSQENVSASHLTLEATQSYANGIFVFQGDKYLMADYAPPMMRATSASAVFKNGELLYTVSPFGNSIFVK